MAAIVTDQFRIANANNFVDSILDNNNSYYVFLGLSNPGTTSSLVGFGRSTTWGNGSNSSPPNPVDNQQYLSHYRNTSLFGKKLNSSNVRRIVRKISWTSNTKYDIYRHDYSVYNLSPNSQSARLYDTNYYVVNSEFKVYICLYNGSHGDISGSSELLGKTSQDEPTFTDLEPSAAGISGDEYIWKYLFTISPSDIVKFDSTEYIVLPNDWGTSTDFQVQSVRDAGDSNINNNQIKIVYIENGGSGVYTAGTYDIKGDGTGAKVNIEVDTSGSITKTTVVAGGSGYTFGIVDFGHAETDTISDPAKLIPIIPPSRGHGYDIYNELGADKVLVYSRFDDSTKDFPTDTKFAQVGIIKNPEKYSSVGTIFTGNEYSSLGSIKLDNTFSGSPIVGAAITQSTDDGTARGYIASYDTETRVLKYYQDRSLNFGNTLDQTDRNDVTAKANVVSFASTTNTITPISGSVDINFSGITTTIGSKQVSLEVTFSGGVANPEINKNTGDIIYIDNRSLVTRDSRQKEDIKIILEF
jgi:hypothetical protein